MTQFLLVFLGAGLGGALRHGVNLACARACGMAFPWGTLVVNGLGSFAMGVVVAWLAGRSGEGWTSVRLLLTTGLLGGFTTFSAFSLDAVTLWERGSQELAAGYVLTSVGLSIAGLLLGLALMRALG